MIHRDISKTEQGQQNNPAKHITFNGHLMWKDNKKDKTNQTTPPPIDHRNSYDCWVLMQPRWTLWTEACKCQKQLWAWEEISFWELHLACWKFDLKKKQNRLALWPSQIRHLKFDDGWRGTRWCKCCIIHRRRDTFPALMLGRKKKTEYPFWLYTC